MITFVQILGSSEYYSNKETIVPLNLLNCKDGQFQSEFIYIEGNYILRCNTVYNTLKTAVDLYASSMQR